jgi:hypothetical protein
MLLRYWTGRVAEPQATLIREHLAVCRECAELLATAGESPVELSTHGSHNAISRPTPFRSASAAATLTPSGRLTFDFIARPMPSASDATPAPPGPGLTTGSGIRSGSGIRPGTSVGRGSRPGHDPVPAYDDRPGSGGSFEAGGESARLTPTSGGPGVPAVLVLGQCPNCGDLLRDVGGQGWCLRCGYTTAGRLPAEVASGPSVSLLWLVPALGGCAGVVAASVLRDLFLPPGSFFQVWWIGVEALIGVVLYLIAHVWILGVTFRHWPEGEMFKYVDPMTVLKYGFAHLHRTRIPISLALWGGTAFLCAFVLFWMNDFAFKDKRKKKRPEPVPVSQGRGFENKSPEEEEAAEYAPPPTAPIAPADSTPSDVALIDLSGSRDPDRQPPPLRSTECVVIGYVPDPSDPDKIDQLILGTRDETGAIRFAGTVRLFARAEEVDRGLAQVKQARPLTTPPEYLPSDLGAIPLEPSLVCRVNFGARDAKGLFQNTVLQGVSRQPADPGMNPTGTVPPKN